jgi:hypothetical protein
MEDKEIIVSPDTKRKERIPPGQKLTEDWPVCSTGAFIVLSLRSGNSGYAAW